MKKLMSFLVLAMLLGCSDGDGVSEVGRGHRILIAEPGLEAPGLARDDGNEATRLRHVRDVDGEIEHTGRPGIQDLAGRVETTDRTSEAKHTLATARLGHESGRRRREEVAELVHGQPRGP